MKKFSPSTKGGAAVFVLVMLGVGLGACDDSSSCPEGTTKVAGGCVRDTSDGGPSAGDGGGDSGSGNGTGDGSSCDPLAADPIDALGVDSNCDGADGIAAEQLFVAPPPLGSDTNVGDPDAPLASLGVALSRSSGTKSILVAVGTYPEAISSTLGAFHVYGGYLPDQGWTRGTERSVLAPNGSGAAAFTAHALGQDSLLEQIEIRARSATDPGSSSVGLSLKGTANVTLQRCRVVAGNGAAGIDGADGAVGHAGENGVPADFCRRGTDRLCVGPVQAIAPRPSTCAAGVTNPLGGAGGTGGNLSVSGVSPTAGSASAAGVGGGGAPYDLGSPDGLSGRAGTDGLPGEGGGGMGSFDASLDFVPPVAPQGNAGTAGEGGGGGGGNYILNSSSPNTCSVVTSPVPLANESAISALGGSGGNGGCGGGAGRGGGGGGGSFAVVASGVSLVFVDTALVTGTGGRGGGAGAGGDGGAASSGGPAWSGGCVPLAGTSPVRGYEVRSGGAGGAGGAGGHGGPGGGGVGGPSIGIVTTGGATAQLSGSSRVTVGSAGVGGSSLGNRGGDGMRATAYAVP